ncbi:50S ribosomal protein L23 [Mycoplasmatota bacterium]|nr:50S ribosomal protein L23 [Mycoplasmatota bacterium]
MKSIYEVLKRPIITEKSMSLVEMGKYTFEVAQDANKIEIKDAVGKLFNVDVEKVNLINGKAKKKRVGKHSGYTAKVKKAIVTIKKGQSIDIFEI